MTILAIDPGNEQSAYALIDKETLRPIEGGILPNDEMLVRIWNLVPDVERVVIEMVASYGMAVGKTVFETVFWIGRFYELVNMNACEDAVDRIYRQDEKMHICHDSRAKDANIRRALIDRFAKHDMKNGRGTKKNPDWFYGFKADMWAAYAVGVTYIETKMKA